MQDRSILSEMRPQVTFALRAAPHLAIALFGSPSRAWRHRIALAAGALAGDVALRRWLEARPDAPPGPARVALDTLEAGLWTWTADDQLAPLLQTAHVLPAGLEAGIRLGAGVDAVPVVRPERPYPPPSPRALSVAKALGPVALPFGAHAFVRHRQGRRYSLVEPVFSTIGAFGLARHRDRMQRDARRRWWDRANALIAAEAERAAVGAAMRPSPGHDFKKTLSVLAWAGSEPARAAAEEQMERPRLVTRTTGGSTLMMTVPGMPIAPWAACDTWLYPADQRRLLAHIDEVDDLLEDRSPAPLIEVLPHDGPGLLLRYRGRSLALDVSPPPLDQSLDAVKAAIGVGITYKLISSIQGTRRVPAWVSVPAALVDVLLLLAHDRARVAQRPERFHRTAVAATVSAMGFMAAARLTAPIPPGIEEFPASYGAFAALGVLGTSNDQVGWPVTTALAGITCGTWLALQRGAGRRPVSAAPEAAGLWATFAGSRGLTTRVASEAASVESRLKLQFAERVQHARRSAARAELDRFRRQVELAETELHALRGRMDPELVEFVRQECEELRQWIDTPTARDHPFNDR